MGLTIVSVSINPTILQEGQTDVVVTAEVIDDIAVDEVSTSIEFGGSEMVRIEDPNRILYRGTLFIPPNALDGSYRIYVSARDAKTTVTNDGTLLRVERSTTPPIPPTPPDENDKCCCKVSLNITAGPVNIYVCGRDSKVESNVPA